MHQSNTHRRVCLAYRFFWDNRLGAVTCTFPQLPELPNPAQHHLAPLLAYLGCFYWGGPEEHIKLSLSLPLHFNVISGIPPKNWKTFKMSNVNIWNRCCGSTDAAFQLCDECTSGASLHCDPHILPAQSGRRWKEINLPWCHCRPVLEPQCHFFQFAKSRKRLIFLITPSSLPSFLIKYGVGMLVHAEPTGNWTFSLTFHINSFIKLCQRFTTLLEVYLYKIWFSYINIPLLWLIWFICSKTSWTRAEENAILT